MRSQLVDQLARQRHREVRAEQQLALRAAALAKASRHEQRSRRRVRWVIRKASQLRSAPD